MKTMRRILGVFVMIAGILGLLLALAGLVVVWVAKPAVAANANSTIRTLNESITTSQNVMVITGKALGATVDSLDALSTMLSTTATTVDDTKPVIDQITTVLSDTLPSTLEATTASLRTAREAAVVLESSIKSLDAFRFLLISNPLLGDQSDLATTSYNPEIPLSVSLNELATTLDGLPNTFVKMSANLGSTDDNMVSIQTNLTTMSTSVNLISSSLNEYENMVLQSQSSMDNLKSILTNLKSNLSSILNGFAIVTTLLLLWFLASQVVILTQGWELFQGTADRLE